MERCALLHPLFTLDAPAADLLQSIVVLKQSSTFVLLVSLHDESSGRTCGFLLVVLKDAYHKTCVGVMDRLGMCSSVTDRSQLLAGNFIF